MFAEEISGFGFVEFDDQIQRRFAFEEARLYLRIYLSNICDKQFNDFLVASQSSSAESRAVEPTLLLISKSAPSFRRIFTVSVYPKKTADIRAALPSLFFRSSLAPPLWRRLPGIE